MIYVVFFICLLIYLWSAINGRNDAFLNNELSLSLDNCDFEVRHSFITKQNNRTKDFVDDETNMANDSEHNSNHIRFVRINGSVWVSENFFCLPKLNNLHIAVFLCVEWLWFCMNEHRRVIQWAIKIISFIDRKGCNLNWVNLLSAITITNPIKSEWLFLPHWVVVFNPSRYLWLIRQTV